jgi:hypothetical protein
MWLKTVEIENIKCFERLELTFTDGKSKHPQPYRWITLLGENGVGKSTLLQAIGLLLAGPEAAKELLPRPTGWARTPSRPGKLTAQIAQDEGDQGVCGKDKISKNFSYDYFVTGDQEVKVHPGNRKRQSAEIYTEPAIVEKSSKLLGWLRANAFASGNEGWFAAGYGSFRRLTRVNRILIPRLEALTRASNFITQFNEDNPISSFEQWMVYLEYRQAKDPTDTTAHRMRKIGKEAVTALLPAKTKIHEVTKDGLVNFEINGQIVSTISLSDGFRSVIALAGDLIWRLLQAFPNLGDPTQATGVVLIDELDIHLHPIWQRDIAHWLRKTFPYLQFIVATHSPLVAIGAGQESLIIRLEMDEKTGVVRPEYINDIWAYDVDQTLRSDAFGLVSTYSPQVQAGIETYHQLRLRDNLNDEEKYLLQDLTALVKQLNLNGQQPEPGSIQDRMNRFLEENLPL